MLSTPSWWECILFALWLAIVVYIPFEVRNTWRDRNKPLNRGLMGPSSIPLDDIDEDTVHTITARHGERVPAVKELRETYPGLSLLDAAQLVDRHRKT
ncbi:hypothetical protein GCM10009619_02840 [Williamsia maris]